MSCPTLHNVEQGTAEWFALRCGVPTASEFSRILTPTGKRSASQLGYLAELVSQRIIGYTDQELDQQARQTEQQFYVSYWAERGHMLEDEGRAAYEMLQDTDVKEIGFITNNGAGCSPDGLINNNGGVEIKCPMPKKHVLNWSEVKANNTVPKDYLLQVHGSLIVSGREFWDFVSYCPGFPLAIARVTRNDFTETLAKELSDFSNRLEEMYQSISQELSTNTPVRKKLPQKEKEINTIVPPPNTRQDDKLAGWISGKAPKTEAKSQLATPSNLLEKT